MFIFIALYRTITYIIAGSWCCMWWSKGIYEVKDEENKPESSAPQGLALYQSAGFGLWPPHWLKVPGCFFLCKIQFINPNAAQTLLGTSGFSVPELAVHIPLFPLSSCCAAAGSPHQLLLRRSWLSAVCVWSCLWIGYCACNSSLGNLICGAKSWKQEFTVQIPWSFLCAQSTQGKRHWTRQKWLSKKPFLCAWKQGMAPVWGSLCSERRTHLLLPNYRFHFFSLFPIFYCHLLALAEWLLPWPWSKYLWCTLFI